MRRLLLFLLIPCFFVACAHGGYVSRSRGAREAFQKGKYDKALHWYQKQKPPERDRLLYLLDQGTILHAAGRHEESLKVFNEAIEFTERKEGKQRLSKTASVVANDNLIPYKGEEFERLLIHLYQILNYLGLEKEDEALVEVRRIFTKFPHYFKEGSKKQIQNGFAAYLSGLVWESQGKLNDAYIDYKTTYRIDSSVPLLPQKLLRGAKALGFLNDYARWKKKFEMTEKAYRSREGQVVFLIEAGEVPEKESSEVESDLQILPIPEYPRLREPLTVTISVNGKDLGKSYPLYRVDEAARETLEEQRPAIIARGLARLAVKEAGAVYVGKKVDPGLGFLIGVLVLATNRADLRSWLTLPQSYQVAEFSLPAGTYTFRLKGSRRSQLFPDITLKAGKRKFLMTRID